MNILFTVMHIASLICVSPPVFVFLPSYLMCTNKHQEYLLQISFHSSVMNAPIILSIHVQRKPIEYVQDVLNMQASSTDVNISMCQKTCRRECVHPLAESADF